MHGTIVIGYTELERKPLKWFEKFEGIRKEFKKITDYRWDNAHYMFTNIFGQHFAFNLHSVNGRTTLNVWDDRGATSIFAASFDTNIEQPIPKEVVKEALKHTEEFTRGKMKCSDCGDWIDYRKNQSHRFFSGIYCSDCWIGDKGRYKDNGGWYEREKKEDYN